MRDTFETGVYVRLLPLASPIAMPATFSRRCTPVWMASPPGTDDKGVVAGVSGATHAFTVSGSERYNARGADAHRAARRPGQEPAGRRQTA